MTKNKSKMYSISPYLDPITKIERTVVFKAAGHNHEIKNDQITINGQIYD